MKKMYKYCTVVPKFRETDFFEEERAPFPINKMVLIIHCSPNLTRVNLCRMLKKIKRLSV